MTPDVPGRFPAGRTARAAAPRARWWAWAPTRARARVGVGLVAAVAALAACGGHPTRAAGPSAAAGGAATPSAATASALHWTSCQGKYQCATLPVPLDHAHPAAGTLHLALIKTPATDPAHRIGSLVVNPGGPGESALASWDFLSGTVDAALHRRFDLVGFDPRGVGSSSPVRCLTGPQLDAFTALDFAPDTAAQRAALQTASQAFAAACQRAMGAELDYVGTADAARDLDDIRRALGERQISYLGFSYGTYLGATFADEYPHDLRATVLDGALDPTLDPIRAADTQSVGFEQEFRAFAADCAAKSTCAWHPAGGDPTAAVQRLMAQTMQSPLPTGTSRTLHSGQLFFGIAVTLYSPTTWPALAAGLAAAQDKGDGSLLLRFADIYLQRSSTGQYSNSLEANLAVNCRDAVWPAAGTLLGDASQAAAQAPLFGAPNLTGDLPCAYWPVRARGPQPPLHAAGAGPILVVATTGDPATPYAEGVALAHQLSTGVLLTRVGDGHTGYEASACVRQVVDRYLITGVSPDAAHRRCAP